MAQFSGVWSQLVDLRLEPFELLAQGVNRSLLQARLRLTVKSQPPEAIFKEQQESARLTQVDLINLPMHGIA